MQLALSLPYAGPVREAIARVPRLERLGLDAVWVPEAYGLDAPSVMGWLAARTERLLIGAGVLPVFSRSPALIAQTAAGVDALSDGRCLLGLGASGPQVIEGWHGVAYDRPVARVRETIAVCRAVWRREPLRHDGPLLPAPLPADAPHATGLGRPLRLVTRPVRPRIPIYVAGLAPRSVALTAEVAEGWLPLFFLPERAGAVWGDPLRAGAARRDPALGPLAIAAGGIVAIGDEPAVGAARELARPELALYVGGMGARGRNFYNDLVAAYGFADDARAIQDLYLDGHREEAAARVPRALLDGLTLCGPEGYVRERLAAYREAGVTMLTLSAATPDLEHVVPALAELLAA